MTADPESNRAPGKAAANRVEPAPRPCSCGAKTWTYKPITRDPTRQLVECTGCGKYIGYYPIAKLELDSSTKKRTSKVKGVSGGYDTDDLYAEQ